jgi:predicted dinucleotide-utilizing enzyme
MSRRTLAAAVVGLGFLGILVVGTLRSQNVECQVTVVFDGQRQQATASAANAEDAEYQAVIAACGPIAPGMDNAIRCGNTPPVEKDCHSI